MALIHYRAIRSLACFTFAALALQAAAEIGVDWHEVENAPDCLTRIEHSAVSHDGCIWLIGGERELEDGSWVDLNDVWSSRDGINWTIATNDAPWGPRVGHSSVVFDNRIWVIGGWGSGYGAMPTGYRNDVWSSEDGINWKCEVQNAPWPGRYRHESIVFDNKIWIIGGADGDVRGDVWSSLNGKDWEMVTPRASWPARHQFASFIYDNKIWIAGGETEWNGQSSNDVWYSEDGKSWSSITSNASWEARSDPRILIINDSMWLFGGFFNDWNEHDSYIWKSNDGVNWDLVHPRGVINWLFSSSPKILFHNGILWMIAGDYYQPSLFYSGSSSTTSLWDLYN